ncbi:ABC transporter permease [Microbacterium aquimaris]|uniref:FtsX-like permease family protein n=1 Tax=Microbacterium aquimaris TaxID=459816 RepID=A0ABU5N2I1_9MICO|nr:ABC transporter permease [Microbacterium aquimaris]MDZ8160288.1 FtsX-like permease family protein [Microbacterium aquimaris]
MKTPDLIGSAVANTFRSKTRTLLTVLAIFVGAFTLTLTSGLGTGINAYIDDTVSSIGATDVMTVTKPADAAGGLPGSDTGPAEYDPDVVSTGVPGSSVVTLTPEDIDAMADIDGVLDVQATQTVTPDYIEGPNGDQFVVATGTLVADQNVPLASGTAPDDSIADFELVLPISYVEPMGFDDADAALGQTVTLSVTDATREAHLVDATVVGVAEEGLAGPGGESILPNAALTDELFEAQSVGLPEDEVDRYLQASVWFDPEATDAQIAALQDRLADEGYTAVTVEDQLGAFTTVIDGIVLVLNAFAIIALLAASFGIVNTLFMSVQERTREIGLMKAMGMGSGRVFSLFSIEATFIGLLGSALGVVIAMVAGTALSEALSTTLLSDLPGLTLIAFDPVSIVVIVVAVMLIAFLAGTLPAARAALADPVESLRYE